jgi:signal transduction histidine kinase
VQSSIADPAGRPTADESVDIAADLAAVARIESVPSILKVITEVTGMGFAAVARVSDQRWTACAVHDAIGFGLKAGDDLPLETTLCREVRLALSPVTIEHVIEDPDYHDHHTPRTYGFQSYISVPIVLDGGEYFGNLCAVDPKPALGLKARTLELFHLCARLIGQQLTDERRHLRTGDALAEALSTAGLREQFIAVLGHDLRNPLNTVRTIAALLQRPNVRDPASLGDMLLRSVNRMSSLIDDVLDFARGRLGSGMELRLQTEANAEQALADVVTELQLASPGRAIEVRLDIGAPLRCDVARLQQLLSNLVGNALAHGAAEQPVVVEGRSHAGWLDLSVHNRGNTIPPDQLDRLFEPYWRAGQPDQPGEGLGLGLYICAEIAKAHGGRMEVTSDEDQGTRFTAHLPLAGPPG